ncbi:MAG: hypothetical protein CMJ81_20950 [Planctomycetaceae bacterium]|nr:hypothetical protein [Planctomycetaceae bacterium]
MFQFSLFPEQQSTVRLGQFALIWGDWLPAGGVRCPGRRCRAINCLSPGVRRSVGNRNLPRFDHGAGARSTPDRQRWLLPPAIVATGSLRPSNRNATRAVVEGSFQGGHWLGFQHGVKRWGCRHAMEENGPGWQS